MSIYFRVNENRVLKAFRRQTYLTRTNRPSGVAQHSFYLGNTVAATAAREGDVYQIESIRFVKSVVDHYEPANWKQKARRVARLKRLYTPEEVKQKRREKEGFTSMNHMFYDLTYKGKWYENSHH